MNFTKEARQKIAEEFIERHGRFDAGLFLDEAQAEQHPAHSWFTWDNDEAARQHRLEEARRFVRDLRIKFEVQTVERGSVKVRAVQAPAFISPIGGRAAGGGYVAVDPNDQAAVTALCQEAARALDAWCLRYGAAVVLAGASVEPFAKIAGRLRAHAVETGTEAA